MQSVNQEVVKYLNQNGFKNVRDSGEEIKFNTKELNCNSLQAIENIPANVRKKVKRSGTGLLIVLSQW